MRTTHFAMIGLTIAFAAGIAPGQEPPPNGVSKAWPYYTKLEMAGTL